ncbi:MAG: immunity protein YezG family protein [Pseudomonadota bacterium]
MAKEKQELLLDLGQIALDIVGIFEPTPFADLTNAGISIWRGNWLDAGLSAVGVIPYLGDAAKLGKLGKFGKVIERAVELAKLDPGFADQLRPALRKIKDAIDAAPVDSLPGPARDAVRSMKGKLDEFFSGAGVNPAEHPATAAGDIGDVLIDMRERLRQDGGEVWNGCRFTLQRDGRFSLDFAFDQATS